MSDVPESVILLHGFAAHSLVMQPLRYRLAKIGYKTAIWTYPSLFRSIDSLASDFRDYLALFDEIGTPYHIVAHSMGSIVTRAAVAKGPNKNLQKLVFLAPPNMGLPAARLAPSFIKRFSRSLKDLEDTPSSFVNSLPRETGHKTGIIAAKCDILIPLTNTHLDGEQAHICINGTHNSILVSSFAFKLIAEFLQNGRFV